MHLEQTLKQMRSMRLSSMAETFEESIRKGEHGGLKPEEFVSILIEQEYSSRKNRKLSRAIGAARFHPVGACIENIRYSMQRGILKGDLDAYMNNLWIENSYSLTITGPTGTGKTYIAEAIGLQACKLDYTVQNYRYRNLLDTIVSARGTGTYEALRKKLEKADVLIIDDFAITVADKHQCSDILELLEERERHGALIVTSQYPMDLWHSRFLDPTIADAICDRLIHRGRHIELIGDSFRKRPGPEIAKKSKPK